GPAGFPARLRPVYRGADRRAASRHLGMPARSADRSPRVAPLLPVGLADGADWSSPPRVGRGAASPTSADDRGGGLSHPFRVHRVYLSKLRARRRRSERWPAEPRRRRLDRDRERTTHADLALS